MSWVKLTWRNTKLFTKEGKTAEILREVIKSIPPKTKVYIVGGAARNALYYDFFKKPLPQRDFDLLLVGNLEKFIKNLRGHKFVYGKISRKDEVVLKKKLVSRPKEITDYLVLDVHRSHEPNVMKNLKASSAFTINGFAIPLRHFLSKDFKKHTISLPGAMKDLKNKKLRFNVSGYDYDKHAGILFSCLRFMSIGFKPPPKKEVKLLLELLPRLEKWRFERNVRKVFDYVGGQKKTRRLVKSLGI